MLIKVIKTVTINFDIRKLFDNLSNFLNYCKILLYINPKITKINVPTLAQVYLASIKTKYIFF